MSWQCTSWALREAPAPTPTARLVLIALADRCQPDGRSAWPTADTLALEAHTSLSSVRRALKGLEESGCIRRGNQMLAQWDEHGNWLPEPYRPVVWECCMGVTLERVAEKPGRQAREERAARRGETAADDGGDSRRVKMTRLENGGIKPKSRRVKMTRLDAVDESRPSAGDTSRPSAGDTPKERTNSEQIFPSAPTGHLLTGETPTQGDRTQDSMPAPSATTDGPVEVGEATSGRSDADRLLDSLAERRSRLGLTTSPATDADRRAVAGLIARLDRVKGIDPGVVILDRLLDEALRRPFWAKRVDSGRRFARHFDEIRNDVAVDAAAAAAGPSAVTADASVAAAERERRRREAERARREAHEQWERREREAASAKAELAIFRSQHGGKSPFELLQEARMRVGKAVA